jgi:acetyl-CoA acetyltransferase
VEINEAFAAIAIVVARGLGLSDDIVNVEGGAIAHGYPMGRPAPCWRLSSSTQCAVTV